MVGIVLSTSIFVSSWKKEYEVQVTKISTDMLVLDDGVVDDVPPEVSEDEGAGHQQVKDRYLDFPDCEGKTEDVETDIVRHGWKERM